MLSSQLIYHITHVSNLPSIIKDGCLWSDRQVLGRGGQNIVIGMNRIKQRRLNEIRVSCHPGLFVGDFVPFYYCPRSIMLYLIHMKSGEIEFQDGQDRIVHLVSSVKTAVKFATDRHWAFSDGNAGTYHTVYSDDLDKFDSLVDMSAVRTTHWGGTGADPSIKHKKQAEFLVQDFFPWQAIRTIGTKKASVMNEVKQALAAADHQPEIVVKPDWYY